jgi:hypothetical protein
MDNNEESLDSSLDTVYFRAQSGNRPMYVVMKELDEFTKNELKKVKKNFFSVSDLHIYKPENTTENNICLDIEKSVIGFFDSYAKKIRDYSINGINPSKCYGMDLFDFKVESITPTGFQTFVFSGKELKENIGSLARDTYVMTIELESKISVPTVRMPYEIQRSCFGEYRDNPMTSENNVIEHHTD